jgi:8-oxo-dGTP pyrophosphatase MutT (NUDIX family)
VKGPRLIVRAILVEESRLLVDVRPNRTALFGGRVERGETVRRALERELDEELGLRVEVGRLAYQIENFFVDDRERRIHELGLYFMVHSARPLGAKVKPREPGLTPSWLPLDAVAGSALLPAALRERLARDLLSVEATDTIHLVQVDRVAFPAVL